MLVRMMGKWENKQYPANDRDGTIIDWYMKLLLQEMNSRHDLGYKSRRRLKTRNRWIFGSAHVIDFLISGRLEIGAPVVCLLLLWEGKRRGRELWVFIIARSKDRRE